MSEIPLLCQILQACQHITWSGGVLIWNVLDLKFESWGGGGGNFQPLNMYTPVPTPDVYMHKIGTRPSR